MTNGRLLIIDDEEKLRHLLARVIALEGFEVFETADAKTVLRKIEQHHIDIVICDVKLPSINGLDLCKEIKTKFPQIEIIVLTAYGNIADGVKAIKNGAFDYITKGDDHDKIIPLLYRAVEKVQLQKRILQLEKQVGERFSLDTIIGHSMPIQNAIDLARKVAATDTTVLLLGETGTGKEVFAQAIHNSSSRKQKAFVAINCSAFSKELLENELFGHKAGAFTGALKDSKGLFEEANQGTLFLDEIGDMNIDLQAKMLRVLETGEFIKVGDNKPTQVNVRIIAATNRDLEKESEVGHFRLDLFYRLSVFQIRLPALRERINDIDLLAEHFTKLFATKINKQQMKLSSEYVEKLKNHPWKGNIRELKNCIERSVIITDEDTLKISSLPIEIAHSSTSLHSLFDLSLVEKNHIQKVLSHTGGNKTEAARLLNIGLTTLYRKIEEYNL